MKSKKILLIHINGRLDTDNFDRIVPILRKQGHVCHVGGADHRGSMGKYDALIVGEDWDKINGTRVAEAKNSGLKTVLLQSEGLFTDRSKWYRGKVPVCDGVATWGSVHEEIFRDRGYKGLIDICGPARYDIYYNFKPSVDKASIAKTIGISANKSILTFMTQIFDIGDTKKLHRIQKTITEMFARLASIPSAHAVIKIHPQEIDGAKTKWTRTGIAKAANPKCMVIDPGGHDFSVYTPDLIYHSAIIVSYTSSTLFEASMLGTPAVCVSPTGEELTPNHKKLGTAEIVFDEKGLIGFVNDNINTRVRQDNTPFLRKFLPGEIDGQNTKRCIDLINKVIGS